MTTDHNDGLTIAQLVRVAAAQFVREARRGADPLGFRFDLYRQVEVPDRALTVLKRAHLVAVRVKVTCESMVFEGPSITAVIPPATLPSR
jgi:hypothetical protein